MKNCPVCQVTMREVPRHGVLIDICPRCRGVWLDHGELEKMLALLSEGDLEHHHHHDHDYADHEYRHRDDDWHEDHYEHRRRKKRFSFLDIFDFD